MTNRFADLLGERAPVFDGGYGWLLQERGLPPGECAEMWNIEQPETISGLHEEYAQAGGTGDASAGEPTQGAGAVAMLVAANPRLVELDAVSGLHTFDVDDFWRPNDRTTALVDGHLSTSAYLDSLEGAWRDRLGWVGGPGRQGILFDGMVETRTGLMLLDTALAGDWPAFRDAFSHIILPASLLGYFSLAYISRMTRSFMLEQLSAEYITTARVKGLPEWRVVWGHAFRNIAIPLITVIALSFGSLLEGSVLTEIIFSWPGIGSYITKALLAGDMNAVLGGTVVVGTCFVVLNLLSDILYRVLDPRSK